MYATGDRVVYQEDGNIIFIGRVERPGKDPPGHRSRAGGSRAGYWNKANTSARL